MARKLDEMSREELLDYIGFLTLRKKFGLVWEDKPEQVAIDCEANLPLLTAVPDKTLQISPELPNHLIIEGDNYHSLVVLSYTHSKSVKVIYIDPPYNTGKDFVYNDRFVNAEDGFRHSKWLSFMSKRLLIARDLLTDDGVIFISIDDNEQANLKLLCDQVFGEANFVGQFIHKNNSLKNQASLLSVSTEYLLCYSKNKENLRGTRWRIKKRGAKDVANTFKRLKKSGMSLPDIESEIKEMYSRPKYSHLSRWNKVDENGVFKDSDLSREGGRKDYTIENPQTGKPVVVPDRGWAKSLEELKRLQEEDLIWYGDEDTPPGMKDYIEEEKDVVPDNFLYFDNSVDTRMIKNMFGSLVFENPKPAEMLKLLVGLHADKDSVILDFFAGSGTTAQAVLELNQEDGGTRQAILCTNNEAHIAENITFERVRKHIEGHGKVKGMPANLRYFRTGFVEKEGTEDATRVKIMKEAQDLISIRENAFEEIVRQPEFSVFSSTEGLTAVITDPDHIPSLVGYLNSVKVELTAQIYVFSLSSDTYAADFEGLEREYQLLPVPEGLLSAYRKAIGDQRFSQGN